jgi:hypothetical protein
MGAQSHIGRNRNQELGIVEHIITGTRDRGTYDYRNTGSWNIWLQEHGIVEHITWYNKTSMRPCLFKTRCVQWSMIIVYYTQNHSQWPKCKGSLNNLYVELYYIYFHWQYTKCKDSLAISMLKYLIIQHIELTCHSAGGLTITVNWILQNTKSNWFSRDFKSNWLITVLPLPAAGLKG